VLAAILMLCLAESFRPQSDSATRAAITRALPLLQKSAAEFSSQRSCFSCHHNGLSILTLRLAGERGFRIDSKTLSVVEEKTFRVLRAPQALDEAVQATNLSDPTPNDSLLLMAAHAAGLPLDLPTAVHAARITRWQRDGHWTTSDFRPPHSSSLFAATATAVRSIRWYMPSELSAERDAAVERAHQRLLATHPESTEDAAFRVMGLVWASAEAAPTNETRAIAPIKNRTRRIVSLLPAVVSWGPDSPASLAPSAAPAGVPAAAMANAGSVTIAGPASARLHPGDKDPADRDSGPA